MSWEFFTLQFMQDTGDYSAVGPRNMSRRQLSNWLVDSAKEVSPALRLTELAFNEDGSFFIQTPENLWAKFLFGCTNAEAEHVLGKVRSGLAGIDDELFNDLHAFTVCLCKFLLFSNCFFWKFSPFSLTLHVLSGIRIRAKA